MSKHTPGPWKVEPVSVVPQTGHACASLRAIPAMRCTSSSVRAMNTAPLYSAKTFFCDFSSRFLPSGFLISTGKVGPPADTNMSGSPPPACAFSMTETPRASNPATISAWFPSRDTFRRIVFDLIDALAADLVMRRYLRLRDAAGNHSHNRAAPAPKLFHFIPCHARPYTARVHKCQIVPFINATLDRAIGRVYCVVNYGGFHP